MVAERPRPKADSPISQRLPRIKCDILNNRYVPKVRSVLVVKIITNNDRPLQTFRGMIRQHVDCIGAFIGCFQIVALRGKLLTPKYKACNGGWRMRRSSVRIGALGRVASLGWLAVEPIGVPMGPTPRRF